MAVQTEEVKPAPKVTKAKAAPVVAVAPKAKTTRVVEYVKVAAPVTPVVAAPTPTPVAPAVAAPPVAPVAAAVVAPPVAKPAPSGVNVETSQLVKSIGMMLLGGGIIAAAVWYFGVDMIMMALYIALPLLCLFVGLRLISTGTLQLIWNGELAERVDAYVKSLGGTPPPKTV